uniref:Ankyrin repeat-containing protein n=1 Tax=Tanacetum cinerariifolium TaxID=118510 RepID=A0A6L2LX31_TANCI|nr:ankyrin repeat-containing protein [Tanacetum cinerariifolium]
MTKIADLESELKGYREVVEDRFNVVEGRFNALEKDVNQKHAKLLAAKQTLTNQVQGLSSESLKAGKNTEQPKATTTNLQFDDLGFSYPHFVSESRETVKKIIFHNMMLGFSRQREGMMFGTGSNGNGDYFRVQGNRLQPVTGMRSYGAEYRLRKLKIHIFEEEDAYGWIYHMERYFHIQGIEATDQLTAAELCLEGQALSWYRWSDGQTPFRYWESFKRRLLNRFQQSQKGSLYEQFLAIKQDGSAQKYVALFEKLAGQLVGVPETIMVGTFNKGLKQDLRAVVRVLNPEGLSHALKLAVSIEENKLFGSASQGSVSSVPTMRSSQFKRLTESEMAEKDLKDCVSSVMKKIGRDISVKANLCKFYGWMKKMHIKKMNLLNMNTLIQLRYL